jgi:CheY-like chemotaxis protein
MTTQVAPTGSGTVLYIDDESSLVEIGKHLLERAGYQVFTETDSSDALRTFLDQPEKFDVVVTDMTMPYMTGIELSKKIMEIRPDIPIILCTGYSELVDKETAEALGIEQFLIKPFSIKKLAAIIRSVLGKKTQR